MGLYCFGIDVGGTSIKCGLFLTDGTLVEKWEITADGEQRMKSFRMWPKPSKEKIEERNIEKSHIDGVGIGIPGPVNEHGEVMCAVNLYWGFKAVSQELSEMTGLPAMAGNDANVAAWEKPGRARLPVRPT